MKAIIVTSSILDHLITPDGITIKLSDGTIPQIGDKLYITGIKPYLKVKRGKTDIAIYSVLSLENSFVGESEFYLNNKYLPKTYYSDIDAVRYINKNVDIERLSNQHWEESDSMFYLMEGEKIICRCKKTAVIPYYIEKLEEAVLFVFNILRYDRREVERMAIEELRELTDNDKSVRYYGLKSFLKNINESIFDFSASWVRLNYEIYPKGEVILFYTLKVEVVPQNEYCGDCEAPNVSQNKDGDYVITYHNHTQKYTFSEFEDLVNDQELETFDKVEITINLNNR